ncbi:organic cation transporter protein-like [Epargyreus clarus]|uniref:organic cation transporter protein-like n=1 Tax=Epargyreus clarus TaxID=520877 RepID=UPI003C2DB902
MAKNKDNNEVVGISEIMETFGIYQKMQYFYCCLSVLFVTMITINYVFVAGEINYRCQVPECDGSNPVYSATWWPNATLDRCYKPILNHTVTSGSCTNNSFTSHVEKCSSWVYESNDTIVAELDLACQPWKAGLVGTVHNIGMLIAMLLGGWLCDRFGRKPTTVICAVGSVIGILKIFASSYYPFIALELLEAAISGGIYTSAMVLMIEITGTKARVLPGVLFAYSNYLGEAVYACIAMLMPYWQHLVMIICLPNVLFLSFIYIVRESPRWQIINGRIDEAKETLLIIAKTNKVNVNKDILASTNEDTLKEAFNIETNEKKEGFSDIIKSREIMKRVSVSVVVKFGTGFIYYGLVMNSVGLPGDKYWNFFMSAAASFPGELIAMYLMNKIGRKKPLIYGYLTCGILNILCAVTPDSNTWLKIVIFLLGKMVMSACFTGMVTYSMELFPTSVRGSLCGFITFAACLGSVLAPLTPMLAITFAPLPFIIFGCSATVAGLLIILTPETKDQPLLDTLEQINASSSKNRRECTANDNPAYIDDDSSNKF